MIKHLMFATRTVEMADDMIQKNAMMVTQVIQSTLLVMAVTKIAILRIYGLALNKKVPNQLVNTNVEMA